MLSWAVGAIICHTLLYTGKSAVLRMTTEAAAPQSILRCVVSVTVPSARGGDR